MMFMLTKFFASRSGRHFVQMQMELGRTNGYIEEMISGQLPKGGENADADYGYSTTEAVDAYYVSLFAVSVAQDSTYAWLYSNVVALGSVKISLE